MTAYFQQGIDTEILGSSIEIVVTETGGGAASDTVTLDGAFFHYSDYTDLDDGWENLEDLLEATLNDPGTTLNATYTVTFNQATGKYTIAASGGGVTAVQIAFSNALTKRVLGFTGTVSGALSHTSAQRCDYYIIGTEGGISEWTRLYEIDDELLEELVGDDGTPAIFAKAGAAKGFDFEVPYEPAASIWTENAGGLWCWEDFFAHARTGAPFVVAVAGLTTTFVALLRKKTAAFKPKLLGDGYVAHASIPISGFYLGPES